MRRTRTNHTKAIGAVALSFAALAAFTGTASASTDDDAASPATEIPYLSHGQGVSPAMFGEQPEVRSSSGSVLAEVPSDYSADWLAAPGGVTHPNPVKLYELQHAGVAQPDGYQPQLRGDEPLVIRDAPDGFVPRTPEPVAVAASSDGFDRDDVAIGFGLGLILATACAAALAAASGRGRGRMAHS